MDENMATQGAPVSIRLDDRQLADELAESLRLMGSDVEMTEERGILPILPFVVAAVLGAAGMAQIWMFIRGKTQCQIIVDARGDSIKKEIDCRIKDGRIIVLTKDAERIEIVDAPPAIDFTGITQAVLTGGADSVVDAVEKAGAKVFRSKNGPSTPDRH
jgi:hypothetical protein